MSLSVINRDRAILALVVVILTLAATGEAQSTVERFQLFNDCQPIDIVVERLPREAGEIGLRGEAIQATVESRLRSAHLYDPEAVPFLYINVNVGPRAFHISLEFHKEVRDLASGLSSTAPTWLTGVTGTHGRDSGYLLSLISRQIEEFLGEFLEVNGEAC
ncbi:MAG: hypothetical protein OXM87_04160 [Truepera sp.]|nr:hypothetical protein [Truepera sp.]